MDLSSQRNELDHIGGRASGILPARAGLRVRPAEAEPTGLFVVVEMTVLVLVAALAMASIIVSSNEMVDHASVMPTERHADLSAARDAGTTQAAGAAPRLEQPRSSDGVASR